MEEPWVTKFPMHFCSLSRGDFLKAETIPYTYWKDIDKRPPNPLVTLENFTQKSTYPSAALKSFLYRWPPEPADPERYRALRTDTQSPFPTLFLLTPQHLKATSLMWTLATVICLPVAALSCLSLTTHVGREARLPGNAAPTPSIDSDGKVCKDHQAAPTEAR